MRIRFKLRRAIRKSWLLSRCYYRCRGVRLSGRPQDEIWYFAYGANMHEAMFRIRRGIQPLECCSGSIKGYRLRFNLDGWPEVGLRPQTSALTRMRQSGAYCTA